MKCLLLSDMRITGFFNQFNSPSFLSGDTVPLVPHIPSTESPELKYMQLAKKENAIETYAKLKDEYLSLKAILQVCGVNLTDIDKMKE